MASRVLLVNMPFGGVDRPAIGISTLKAALTQRGHDCDIRYLNFLWAEMVGTRLYKWFIDRAPYMIFAGEWMFASEFFGPVVPPPDAYYRYLRSYPGVDDHILQAITTMRKSVRPFLDKCLDGIDWERYAVVGFTSTFEQNIASLALAHAVKSRHRKTIIVMGGANCDGNMGVALHRHFPFLDYVFTGPSDHTFAEFISRVFRGNDTGIDDIPGIAHRVGSETRLTAPAEGVSDMDSIPVPDYDDYFSQMEGTDIARTVPIRLQIETSRGCWWGMKKHCTFCGFNATSMRFRSKSDDRVLSELEHLVERHGVTGIDAVDSIMDMRFFRGLLQRLRDRRLGVQLFYEMKANLTKAQVQLLAEAGVVFIQPGIESLSTRILNLMRKGATALQNVQLLKWCRQFNIAPTWNLLYGFPGERLEDYARQLDLMRSLSHLPPPGGMGRLRMDRFSPHFDQAAEYGFVNVRPVAAYRYIYPLQTSAVADIGYYFDYDYADGRDPDNYVGPTKLQVQEWREASARGASLDLALDSDGSVTITDTRRPGPPRTTVLRGWESVVYAYCEQARPYQSIARLASRQLSTHECPEYQLELFLRKMIDQRLMVRDEHTYLGMAVGLPLGAEPQSEPECHTHEVSSRIALPVLSGGNCS